LIGPQVTNGRMKLVAIPLAFGVIGLVAFYMGVIKGEIKWSPEKMITGAQARMIGVAGLLLGLVLIAVGGYLAFRVLSE
jgi:hypothetical protein